MMRKPLQSGIRKLESRANEFFVWEKRIISGPWETRVRVALVRKFTSTKALQPVSQDMSSASFHAIADAMRRFGTWYSCSLRVNRRECKRLSTALRSTVGWE